MPEETKELTMPRETIELIKRTVAVNATDNELSLFLYTAKRLGLDPLARQIHFVKRRRRNPVTKEWEEVGVTQIGIDGFRVIAERTHQLSGIKRGVTKDDKGKLIGGWAEVKRKDWDESAREEVSFDEYCQRNREGEPVSMWAAMPEFMIKKCAEAATLRMAFPCDLSGVYVEEEMETTGVPLITAGEEEEAKLKTPPKSSKPVKPEEKPEEKEIKSLRQQLHIKWDELRKLDETVGDKKDWLKEHYGVESSIELSLEQIREAVATVSARIEEKAGPQATTEEKREIVKELRELGKNDEQIREVFYNTTGKKGGWSKPDIDLMRAEIEKFKSQAGGGEKAVESEAEDFLAELGG